MSPPPIEHPEVDCVQQEPEDNEFRTWPDQAARDGAISDFLKRLEAQGKRSYTGLDEVLSRVPVFQNRWTLRGFQSPMQWMQACCRA